MKRFLTFFLLLIIPIFIWSQKYVSYTYKPLAAEGCTVGFTALQQDTVKYIIVRIQSDRLQFSPHPILMLKTYEDEVIKLSGLALNSSSESTGIMIGNMMIPITEISALAQFPINNEQIEKLNKGITKVRISTVPLIHERVFKKDKIGKKLYKQFQKLNDFNSDF